MPGRLTPPMPERLVAAMGDERIHERAAGVAGGRVHDEVRRLVDDDEVGVLVDDVERDGLGGRLGRLRLRHHHAEGVPRFDPIGPISYGRAARTGDVAGADQRLEARAAQSVDALGEQLVEADSGVGFGDGQLDPLRRRVDRRPVSWPANRPPNGLHDDGRKIMQATDAMTAPPPAMRRSTDTAEARLQRTLKIVVFALAMLMFAGLAAIVGRDHLSRVGRVDATGRPEPGDPAGADAVASTRAPWCARSRFRAIG